MVSYRLIRLVTLIAVLAFVPFMCRGELSWYDGGSRDVVVKEAVFTDSNLVKVLEQSIVPFAKANDYNAKRDMISVSINEKSEDDADIIIEISPGDNMKQVVYTVGILQDVHSPVYQTTIDNVKIFITGVEKSSMFKVLNKTVNLGTIATGLNFILYVCDDCRNLELHFKKRKNYFRLESSFNYICKWTENEESLKYLPSLPIKKALVGITEVPLVDTTLNCPAIPERIEIEY